MDAQPKSTQLGKGLAALLGDDSVYFGSNPPAPANAGGGSVGGSALKNVPIEFLRPSKHSQPRQTFADDALDNLAASIRENGILQPILVRPHPDHSSHYEIVAGERRWRAAQRAGLHDVPVIERRLTNLEALQIALIENVQREDLNPLEEGYGYKRLMDEFTMTQDQIAQVVGKSRSHVSNLIRILELPGSVRLMIQDNKLSAGHAKTLLNSDFPEILAQQIANRSLSVRDAEKLSKQQKQAATQDNAPAAARAAAVVKDADTIEVERRLSNALGMRVNIARKGNTGAGVLYVQYKNLEQLELVITRLIGKS